MGDQVVQRAREYIKTVQQAAAENYLKGMIAVDPNSKTSERLRDILREYDPIKYAKPSSKSKEKPMERMTQVVSEAADFSGYPYRIVTTKGFRKEIYLSMNTKFTKYLGDMDTSSMLTDILDRSNTRITLRDDDELQLMYVVLSTTMWSHKRQVQKAESILEQIRPRVKQVNPELVNQLPGIQFRGGA